MKRIISLFLIFGLMLSTVVFAQTENEIKFIKSEENYDYGMESVYIATNKATGKIIPLSVGPFDGYSYSYLPKNEDFEINKIEYKSPFNDLGEKYKYENTINEMAARGVLIGFEDGSFKPEKELSRAEMATVFTRLFSIEQSKESSCFKDMGDGHWSLGYVMALVEKGVLSKGENFYPNDLITREQLVAMTYRMVSDMDCIKKDVEYDFSQYRDYNGISDYAKEAYRVLMANNYVIFCEEEMHDPMDFADDEYFLNPKKSVTRLECANYLYYFINNFMRKNAPAIKKDNAPEFEIPTLDGSTSTYAISQNIYSLYYDNCENHPNYPKAHSKTTNSYKRLIDGEVEMIFVPDASEDVMKYAEEKGVKLKFIPIANEALIFFTAKDNKVKNITTEQLYEIYVNNGIANWEELGGDDKILAAFCRNNDSGSHAQMEKFILDGKEINENISKERISMIMATILTDVEEYNRENLDSYAMGYSLYYYFFNVQTVIGTVDLSLMSIDGVAPTDETISKGEYPYTTNYYAVIRDEDNEKVEAFAKLMQSEFGDEIARLSGLGIFNK